MGATRNWGSYGGVGYLRVTPDGGTAGKPLVVALHGCTQEPDDFADAMQIDYWAEEYGYSAVFPNQNDFENMADCWEWWQDWECSRGSYTAKGIADVFRHERANLDAGPGYILGFSAGAAYVPNLIANYPDLYDAAGIHSGCEFDAADTSSGAYYVMENGGPDPHDQGWYAYDTMRDLGLTQFVPTMVFQGKDDTTVEPPNGKQCAIQAATTDYYVAGGGVDVTLDQASHTRGCDGKCYDRYQFTDDSGRVHADLFRVDGLGHDWAGGDPDRVYADPYAPEATDLMFEFFGRW